MLIVTYFSSSWMWKMIIVGLRQTVTLRKWCGTSCQRKKRSEKFTLNEICGCYQVCTANDVHRSGNFHMNTHVNRHKCRNGHMKCTTTGETPWKLLCGVALGMTLLETFSFAQDTITASIYLNVLQLFVFLQPDGTEQEKDEILLQPRGAPLHLS
jgi:hypothetical protein